MSNNHQHIVRFIRAGLLCASFVCVLGHVQVQPVAAATPADPGYAVPPTATGPSGANLPAPLPGIDPTTETAFFCAAVARFTELQSVSGVNPGTGQCTPTDGGHNSTSNTIPCAETSGGLPPVL